MDKRLKGVGMTSLRTRERLIQRLQEQGIRNEPVLQAILNTPRHIFVDEALASRAYEDTALPIGYNQTISQPYIVARMTEALLSSGSMNKVLEVGTGSGYQTAVLAGLVAEVYSIERIEPLLRLAKKRLQTLGITNVQLKLSDGSWGWAEHAPYDGIIVTAAAAEIPQALLEQLAGNGQMVVPVGQALQELLSVKRQAGETMIERLELVNFVPLIKDQG
ncbi:MAG TPA: protein-L-isoaspartate(D-aspartate) O-methyltransferase [Acidiferrobacterales bacterium]|nr:protein-L-isoaspartate(D-aspartate) O-methyltransferase [Acidiferrobacterales bacterium]